ncbi:MAG: mycothiol system anti-sigma-R factor [Dermatophilaceae bacterium]
MSHDHSDCSEVLLRVFEYIDEEMGPDDCARIRAHLDECEDCMSEYERDLLLKALVRRSCGRVSAPDTLRLRIVSRFTTIHVEIEERRAADER